MKKLVVCISLLIMASSVQADVLLPPEAARSFMEEAQRNCPKDKPIFDGRECHSCDEPGVISYRYQYGAKCSEVCSNRESIRLNCVLKNAPGPDYFQDDIGNWITCADIEKEGHAYVDKEVCLACPNTVTRYLSAGSCYAACPDDAPILDVEHRECTSCRDTRFREWAQPLDLKVTGCSKCSNKIYNVHCVDLEENKDE